MLDRWSEMSFSIRSSSEGSSAATPTSSSRNNSSNEVPSQQSTPSGASLHRCDIIYDSADEVRPPIPPKSPARLAAAARDGQGDSAATTPEKKHRRFSFSIVSLARKLREIKRRS